MKEDLMIQQLSKCSGNTHILKRDEEEKIQSLKNISLFSRTKEELKKKSKTKIEDIFNKNTYNITNVNILNNDNIQYPSFNTLNNNIKTCKINNTIMDKLKKKEEQRKCSNILNSIVEKKSVDSSSSYFSEEFSKNKYKNYLLNKSSVYLKSKCHKESNINLNLKKLERLQKKMKNVNNIGYLKKGNIESSDEHKQSGSDNYDDNISDDNRSDDNISDDNRSDDNRSDDNIYDDNISDDNISDDNISDDNISDDNRSDNNICDDNISDDNISDNNICDDNISDDNRSDDDNISGDNNISDDNKNDDDNIRNDNYINYDEYNNNISDDKNSLSKYVYEKRFKLNLLKDGSNENIYSIVSKRKYNNTYKKKCLYLGMNKLNNICKENLKIKRSYLRYCGENASSGNRKLSNVFHCEDIFKNLKSHISLDNFLTLIYKTSSFIFYYMVRVFQTFQNHINAQFYESSDSNSK